MVFTIQRGCHRKCILTVALLRGKYQIVHTSMSNCLTVYDYVYTLFQLERSTYCKYVTAVKRESAYHLETLYLLFSYYSIWSQPSGWVSLKVNLHIFNYLKKFNIKNSTFFL